MEGLLNGSGIIHKASKSVSFLSNQFSLPQIYRIYKGRKEIIPVKRVCCVFRSDAVDRETPVSIERLSKTPVLRQAKLGFLRLYTVGSQAQSTLEPEKSVSYLLSNARFSERHCTLFQSGGVSHLLFSALRSNLSRLNRSRLGTRMMQISAAVKPPLYRQ